MRIKTVRASLIGLVAVIALLPLGCQNTAEFPQNTPDPFTTTWDLGEEDRVFGISGDRAGHTAEGTSEFELTMDNLLSDGPWQGQYCILLLDRNGILDEVTGGQYDVPAGVKTRETIAVTFPEGYTGPLGLCVVVPECASVVTTLWVGTEPTSDAGSWPIILDCP
ncbi:MAG: hypothetical protein JW846_11505 [Dehalococcoidia bacterium]|nr:hypothetical protein [Dehalococcoidia bacterium]